ncbi:hypothetical protein F511_43717 [Dorcoceras hygrometricum]|uniref:Uncharacterized protein n=1 Tax=Dorcoceras hygrometricum TaxID=472368 RepID=A0A2Z7B8W6_9LAMI|nr:hypothetical protein F511_43717 [Dorcoceras hygrometricum]
MNQMLHEEKNISAVGKKQAKADIRREEQRKMRLRFSRSKAVGVCKQMFQIFSQFLGQSVIETGEAEAKIEDATRS